MAIDFSFEIEFDVTLAVKVLPGERFRGIINMRLDGGQPGGVWHVIGRPDNHLLKESFGTFRFGGQNDCILMLPTSRKPFATLKDFSYDVKSGVIQLDPDYLESIRNTRAFRIVSFGLGTWTTTKHEYSHGSDALIFTDDANGNVLDRFGSIMYRPQRLDPHMILREGYKNKGDWHDTNIRRFGQGNDWDAQRTADSDFHHEFQDYATVLIGIYYCGTGASLTQCLTTQNRYAHLFGSYPSHPIMDSTYTGLPVRNVFNTGIGYDLVNQKRIVAT